MKKIGMIVPTMDNSFFASLVHATAKRMVENDCILAAYDSQNDAEIEKQYYRNLEETGADGIISVSGLSRMNDEILSKDVPLVWVDRVPQSEREIPWVANDDEEAMKEATQCLIDRGCRNILLLPGYIAEEQDNPRVKGYRDTLSENGIPFNSEFILKRSGKGTSESETEALVMELLKSGTKVDGVITSSDRAAFGAVKAFGRVGYYVPEDVKLISFDNSPYSMMASPSITAIDRNPEQLADKACEIMLSLVNGKNVETKNIVKVSLVQRDSTR